MMIAPSSPPLTNCRSSGEKERLVMEALWPCLIPISSHLRQKLFAWLRKETSRSCQYKPMIGVIIAPESNCTSCTACCNQVALVGPVCMWFRQTKCYVYEKATDRETHLPSSFSSSRNVENSGPDALLLLGHTVNFFSCPTERRESPLRLKTTAFIPPIRCWWHAVRRCI
jgi:hypothetical protein